MPNQIESSLKKIQKWSDKTASGPGSEAYRLKIRAQKLALAATAAAIDENLAECKSAIAALDRALQAIADADKKIGTIATAFRLVAQALNEAEQALKMVGAI